MPPTPTSHGPRSANACVTCRRRKVKCSGTQPCQTCSRQGLECHFGHASRRGFSEVYVQGLLEKIKQFEQREKSRDAAAIPSPSGSRRTADHSPADKAAVRDSQDESPSSPITELPPGPAFESRVRSVLYSHGNHARSDSDGLDGIAGAGLAGQWQSSAELVEGPPLVLPPRAESLRLFDVFVSLLGINQHFLDPRAFSDSVDLLYRADAPSRPRQMQTPWFTQYLLVMAVAMLIGSPRGTPMDKPPGNMYFAEAVRRLPPLHELGPHGIIAVEIMCLASLYLQWCDRKHDAYVYIGSAVRLAIALGCSLPYDEQPGLPSEICHRTRVWWTVYMLDRRLSAGLGLPAGADDRQLRADLPRPSAGFQPPLPMIINIKIAQATSEIMTSLYGHSAISQTELVRRIQDTLYNLHEIGRSIPAALSVDFADPGLTVTRTSASLYLMLFQSIILCIRPVLLQCVKDKVQQRSSPSRSQPAVPSAIVRLCQSCKEAAIKSIQILSSIRRQKSIALFGYFDLDATFSAAFVLVMMGFVESRDYQRPPEGVRQAAGVLQYLSRAGNHAARQRLDELRVFCRHVWSPDDGGNTSEEWGWLYERDRTEASLVPARPAPDIQPCGLGAVAGDTGQGAEAMDTTDLGLEAWMGWQHGGPWTPAQNNSSNNNGQGSSLLDFDIQDSSFVLDLSNEAGDIYSSFNDPALPLTGIDDMDWAEVGKMFYRRT